MPDEMRLNKYLARFAGVSRREADRLIEEGKVRVNGKRAELGLPVSLEDDIYLGDNKIEPRLLRHYYLIYKPVGYISSTVKQDKEDKLVTELIKNGDGTRLFPVGRLDKDSEGLMLLTDDGELMDRVLRARNGHEKEYRVSFYEEVSDRVIKEVSDGGLDIGEGRPTRKCRIKRAASDELLIILTEGMNRQIRRVFAIYGLEVKKLCRVRFMNLTIEGLKPGEFRVLSDKEIDEMKAMAGND
ncbi:MAG: rRNA pseudouridine synthase [Lachnospiraceae bacterium]|nr:rRNA pseudouridine synthase [Lachnospiraceae bacterium]